jgi:hypothetical protein
MLFRYELKKLLRAPAIIVFVVLCLILNAVIAIGNYNAYEEPSDAEPVNVFENYPAGDLAEGYIKKYGVTGANADNIRAKYAKLQPVIGEKAANGDALSRYFGDLTHLRHSLLFGTILKVILMESCLLALLFALLSVTYEKARNTEHTVFSSKTGRRIMRVKLAASLTASLAATAVILAVSLLVVFVRFGWRGVWGENVSSDFNFTIGEFPKPFITWHSFTVLEYLWAVIGAALLLAVCFCLLGYAVGVAVRSGYGSVITAIAILALMGFAEPLFPTGSITKSALNLDPVGLWWNCGAWFTDGGPNIIWPDFESVGLAASLAALSLAAFIITKTFRRKEIL